MSAADRTGSVESAVFVDDVATVTDLDREFDRVYFGNEFCDKRLPSPDEVRAAYEYCRGRDLPMTLVTPIVTPTKTGEVRALFEELRDVAEEVEVVFNDWGVYRLADEFGAFEDLVAGRVLSQQKRDPVVSHLSDGPEGSVELSDDEAVVDGVADHFKKSVVNVPYVREHLSKLGVDRVEMDVLTQGVYDEDIAFSGSIYYPWNYVAVRRWCQESTSAPLCDECCDSVVYTLDNRPVTPEPLYRQNNVVFTYNEAVPDVEYVDREVFVPEPIN